jgi:murein DD-endopeptidase MepM/ murein hydrolase activator NlpD
VTVTFKVTVTFLGWKMRISLSLLLLALILTACAAPASSGADPTALPAVPVTETIIPSETPAPTFTASPPPSTPTATPSPSPTADLCVDPDPVCVTSGHFWLIRPIDPLANLNVDRTYPYASTQNGDREVHHGVEFPNAQGTPVLAAAGGKVIFAGDDKLTLLAWVTAFYGNVIVLEHQIDGQTLYTLYGHLYKIDVAEGDVVQTGQKIGEVGASGTAIGSHLHFEVRLGQNNYKSTRNPELWVEPVQGTGVVAGAVLDGRGNPVKATINIQKVENGQFIPISIGVAETYPKETIHSDDLWQESFVFGGLPEGEYRLSLVHYAAIYEQVVKIEAGKLTLVRFIVK